MIWKCHVDEYSESRYLIIPGRELLIELGLDIKFSEHAIIGDDVPYEGYFEYMVDISNCDFKSTADKTVKPEESFINFYIKKCFEP